MTWNYRLMRHEDAGDVSYIIHEVYYDEDGNVTSWTDDGANVVSDDRIGVLRVLAMMAEAYRYAVLDGKTGVEVEPVVMMSDELAVVLKHVMHQTSPLAEPADDQ